MLQSDTFWAMVGLVLFLVVVLVVGAPRQLISMLDRRTDRIRHELDEARKAREEAQALLSEYQRKRRDAEVEAEAIVDEARREAKRLTEEANQKLTEMVERRTKSAEAKIAQAEAQAIGEVKSRAAELAVSAAANILSKKLQGEPGNELIGQGISHVRERMN